MSPRFLLSRGDAFLSDLYYQSDKDWMDLDSKLEITIGPYEVIPSSTFIIIITCPTLTGV